jgi:bifunctional lysine-specific demethylase and histidyl-hydroxylase NO66
MKTSVRNTFFHNIDLAHFENNILGKSILQWEIDTRISDPVLAELALDSIVFSEQGRWGQIRVANVNGRIDPDWITESTPTPAMVNELQTHGYTVVINNIQQKIYRLFEWSQQFASLLDGEVNCNAYITPPGEQGLETHYDDHDVIVLQLSGTKQWTLFHPEHNINPIEGMEYRQEYVEQCTDRTEHTLERGAVLYIPAGFPHSARTVGSQTSTHLTFSLRPYHVQDVVINMLSLLGTNNEMDIGLRERVKKHHLQNCSVDKELEDVLVKVLDHIRSRSQDDSLINGALEMLASQHSRDNGHYAVNGGVAPVELDAEDTLIRNDMQTIRISKRNAKAYFKGGDIDLTPEGEDILQQLIHGHSIRVRDLPGTTLEQKIELANLLLTNNLVATWSKP